MKGPGDDDGPRSTSPVPVPPHTLTFECLQLYLGSEGVGAMVEGVNAAAAAGRASQVSKQGLEGKDDKGLGSFKAPPTQPQVE